MTLLEAIIGRCALPVALLLNPILLARCSFPRADREQFPLVSALWALSLQPIIALGMHWAGLPIDALPLALCHGAILIASVGWLRVTRRSALPPSGTWPQVQLLVFVLLAVLVYPFTHLTGIDPYKWGDLATAVAVDQSAPWLVHPLSLIGFTPRSLASLHPLLMGSIQALGSTEVESAFYLSSLVICAVGVTGAHYLATRLGMAKREARLYASFYAFSPVFVRYVHWGTGRGAFLAVLPLFIASLISLRRLQGWGLMLFSGLLLVLSHKTGLVAIALLPAVGLAFWLFPHRHPTVCMVLLLLSFAASVCFAPPRYIAPPIGWIAGWLRYDLARFAWVSPAVLVVAILSRRTLFRSTDSNFMWMGLLIIFPLAHHKEMYPAMMALPFVTYAGMAALRGTQEAAPRLSGHCWRSAITLSVCASLVIVVQRSVEATPHRFHSAAKFIERTDPLGPFDIVSPWSYRIQGIVSGCPRFAVLTGEDVTVSLTPPPPFTSDSRQMVLSWANYLRSFVRTDVRCDWYGSPDRRYHVIDSSAPTPRNTVLVYEQEGVRVYKEALGPDS